MRIVSMKIRTTEPVQGTDGKVYPTGTEATLVGNGRWEGGLDFETEDGATLWALVPIQYEVIEPITLRFRLFAGNGKVLERRFDSREAADRFEARNAIVVVERIEVQS